VARRCRSPRCACGLATGSPIRDSTPSWRTSVAPRAPSSAVAYVSQGPARYTTRGRWIRSGSLGASGHELRGDCSRTQPDARVALRYDGSHRGIFVWSRPRRRLRSTPLRRALRGVVPRHGADGVCGSSGREREATHARSASATLRVHCGKVCARVLPIYVTPGVRRAPASEA
jgi:hypothetical protein